MTAWRAEDVAELPPIEEADEWTIYILPDGTEWYLSTVWNPDDPVVWLKADFTA